MAVDLLPIAGDAPRHLPGAALGLTATRLRRLADRHGPESVVLSVVSPSTSRRLPLCRHSPGRLGDRRDPEERIRARAQLNESLEQGVVCGQHGWRQACPEIGAPGYDPSVRTAPTSTSSPSSRSSMHAATPQAHGRLLQPGIHAPGEPRREFLEGLVEVVPPAVSLGVTSMAMVCLAEASMARRRGAVKGARSRPCSPRVALLPGGDVVLA